MSLGAAARTQMADADALEQLERIAREMDAIPVADEVRALRDRLDAGRFYVACVGQFKRGKSTLINALVGEAVLPTAAVPVTAVPTVLRAGARGARVEFLQDVGTEIPIEALAQFVTEEGNPDNAKGVLATEVTLRAPLLCTGLCLVDTPGLGSVFASSTELTRAFVPQIDAALVVLGADPPISAEELTLVGDIAESMGDLVFVLNKMDRVPASERVQAAAFTRRVLRERLGSPVAQVLEVSALAALTGEGDAGDWTQLVTALERLALTRRESLLGGARRRGLERLGLRLERTLQEERAALVRPISESERRAGELRELAASSERSLHELEPLLRAEQDRLRRRFEAARLQFLQRALPESMAELERRLNGLAQAQVRVKRAVALDTANAVAREWLGPWLAEAERDAEAAYHGAMERFTELGAGALNRLAQLGDSDLSVMLVRPDSSQSYRVERGFYFHDLLHRHDPPKPWRKAMDALLPREASLRRVGRAAERYLGDLLVVNASRVEGDLADRVEEGRRQLGFELARVLQEVSQGARQALSRASEAHAAGEEAVRAALAATEQRLAALSRIMGVHVRAA
jgi:GTP-binding protein EngB required for normal cell division